MYRRPVGDPLGSTQFNIARSSMDTDMSEKQKQLVLVETISMHRIRYAIEVEADSEEKAHEYALDTWVLDHHKEGFNEMSQKHMGDIDISARIITKEEYIKIFDQDNDYLSEINVNYKLDLINRIQN